MDESKISTSKTINTYNNSIKRINSAFGLRREDILNNFSKDLVSQCWEVFCKFIIKNYESGKGTLVPKFGTFTFTYAELNMEGTTNSSKMDTKPRLPVFIVSKEFVEKLKAGIWTESNGIIYYNPKESNSISIVRLNYTELSYGLNISKEDYTTILNNLLGYIGETIIYSQFKNKEMPGLGKLEIRNNILAVRFNQDLCLRISTIPHKLSTTKKFVNLFMEVNKKQENPLTPANKNFKNTGNGFHSVDITKSLQKLRPKT